MNRPLGIIGAGAWGTALAIAAGHAGHPVRLWGRDTAAVQAMARDRVNRRNLPDCPLPDPVQPQPDLTALVAECDDLLLVVPSRAFESMLHTLAPLIERRHRLGWATKGLDAASGGLLSQVVQRVLKPLPPLAVLSGPSFAAEVGRGLPTAVTVAATDQGFASDLADAFRYERFRVYTSTDLVGVQLGGAVKNVLAIATGVADGLGFGANARAALITRGLAETRRLSEALGADPDTLTGLAGMGDLILTCTDDQSRNRRLGLALGRGEDLDEAVEAIGTVEGVRTADELHRLATQAGVEMPICEQVHLRLAGRVSTREAVENLLLRPGGRQEQ
ncbi:NAD(P)H-dependent glycerol-3-phosphate dehydrogenase [Alkalilimnicola ehrlichii MLHE-1]|uniref:Glycerol-3-phosphate dehydrogenase [NAD(P)+] n=1 Tax=Alkalilimnicola ehrlichii (strain ATCC BAA-1101 / DSM 17681 / MLHE-1) TaxID=187272 RepID=GPDA_ALKEH|nr:NAD(P)H-dependent glycerol-3-phosphate dehydrogenase [Alkalilimnicola ehrlichii]Q0A5H5.1 RecName: Full=Glycerol-3-phosphate dehydrogenase [NAD(P)+]; AltName: Full=NAD(P)H-dependent glycerol-3-phosphate dehydrogenase [Alkalilimnicola ehrlichii MLHE-1]ABI57912.1 glycerol 3-phosphate dehydrogenase (NAD(P)+) [Alkalilimnicola ehrlichii MLHE-1]